MDEYVATPMRESISGGREIKGFICGQNEEADDTPEEYCIGRGGVTKIVRDKILGPHDYLEVLQVYKGEQLHSAHLAYQLRSVYYKD
jgi:hypothetical protein